MLDTVTDYKSATSGSGVEEIVDLDDFAYVWLRGGAKKLRIK